MLVSPALSEFTDATQLSSSCEMSYPTVEPEASCILLLHMEK